MNLKFVKWQRQFDENNTEMIYQGMVDKNEKRYGKGILIVIGQGIMIGTWVEDDL